MTTDPLPALSCAVAYGMGNTIFRLVRPGYRFRFAADAPDSWNVKGHGSYYTDAAGRRYQTGANTAVFAEHIIGGAP